MYFHNILHRCGIMSSSCRVSYTRNANAIKKPTQINSKDIVLFITKHIILLFMNIYKFIALRSPLKTYMWKKKFYEDMPSIWNNFLNHSFLFYKIHQFFVTRSFVSRNSKIFYLAKICYACIHVFVNFGLYIERA